MIRSLHRLLAAAALAVMAFTLAACTDGGHTRGMFNGQVIGKTEAEIVEKYGKPARVDRSGESATLVYTRKTFDPDNENRVDSETIVYLTKGKDGKVVASDVLYRG